MRAGADALVIDTAHGHTRSVVETVQAVKGAFPKIDVVAGNIATAEGATALIKAGADGIKVGMGPASICTTRVVSGVGVPQLTAIADAVGPAARGHPDRRGRRHQVLRRHHEGARRRREDRDDRRTPRRHEESPGETILYQGRTYKLYRGMGRSKRCASGRQPEPLHAGRGGAELGMKLVPEGIEGRVPYKARSRSSSSSSWAARAGMGYIGARTLDDLARNAKFIRVTDAGHKEGHVHDVYITKEAPTTGSNPR